MQKELFMTQLSSSLTQPKYYIESLSKNWSQTIWFCLPVLILAICLQTIVSGARLLPVFLETTTSLLQDADAHYPEDLVISWENQQLHLSQETLIIPIPEKLRPFLSVQDTNTSLAVFSDIEDIPAAVLQPSQKALIFIQPTSLFLYDPSGEVGSNSWQQYSLSSLAADIPSTSINKTDFSFMINQTIKRLEEDKIALFLLFFLAQVIFLSIGTALFTLVESILLYLFTLLLEFKYSPSTVFKLAVRIVTTATLIATIGILLYPELTINLRFIAFWATASIVLLQNKQNKTQATDEA